MKTRVKRDSPEPLHQIGRLIENFGPETLVDALAELLGEDGYERLADAISRRAAKG